MTSLRLDPVVRLDAVEAVVRLDAVEAVDHVEPLWLDPDLELEEDMVTAQVTK